MRVQRHRRRYDNLKNFNYSIRQIQNSILEKWFKKMIPDSQMGMESISLWPMRLTNHWAAETQMVSSDAWSLSLTNIPLSSLIDSIRVIDYCNISPTIQISHLLIQLYKKERNRFWHVVNTKTSKFKGFNDEFNVAVRSLKSSDFKSNELRSGSNLSLSYSFSIEKFLNKGNEKRRKVHFRILNLNLRPNKYFLMSFQTA